MFLYCSPGLFAGAYFITPDENGEEVQHQYGCVCCNQFSIKGTIEEIKDSELVSNLVNVLGCDYFSPEAIKLATGLDVAEVLGESLMRLTDGRYVAVENCD